jgi:hypothetical protein
MKIINFTISIVSWFFNLVKSLIMDYAGLHCIEKSRSVPAQARKTHIKSNFSLKSFFINKIFHLKLGQLIAMLG